LKQIDKNLGYYYNNVPGYGLCRNNLIYTSLMSANQKVFVQWYYNDTEYHKGQNQVINPIKMLEKWEREVKFLILMSEKFPDLIPKIIDIDYDSKKIYLEVDGPDFWECSGCDHNNFDKVLPDWKDQILAIIAAHKSLGMHKYSMHPSSFFIVDGKLKSINYFFSYLESEPYFSIKDVESHIYSTRQDEMRKHLGDLGIKWDDPQPFTLLDRLCWYSFGTNYPSDFIETVLCLI
jgi:hypothetical protein